jgi:hypothetical protein
VYYISYPHPSLKKWWVVYKVNPKKHNHRYDEYIERHKDDDIHQAEIEVHQSFTVSNGAGLTELDTGDTKFLDEEVDPSKKCV